jgi:hypothetical protein
MAFSRPLPSELQPLAYLSLSRCIRENGSNSRSFGSSIMCSGGEFGKPLPDFPDHALRLAQAQADRRCRSALRSVGRAAPRAKYRHQGFVCLAAYSAVGLYRSDGSAGPSGIALWSGVAFWSGSALRSLWSLRPRLALISRLPLSARLALSSRLALGPRHALGALRALRTGRTLCPGFSLGAGGPRIPAATGEHHRRANNEDRYDLFHLTLPSDIFRQLN